MSIIKKYQLFSVIAFTIIFTVGCNDTLNDKSWIIAQTKQAEQRLLKMDEELTQKGNIGSPRTTQNDTLSCTTFDDWTSGFYPGSMWYAYAITSDTTMKRLAEKYTNQLKSQQYLTAHHDIGFMMGDSYGNQYRFTGDTNAKKILIQSAKSLMTRYRPNAGVIQSWDIRGWQATRGWECPVIIDNMMNLELLFDATHFTGDSLYYKAAVNHATNTIKNHYRTDNSCYHVIDYDLKDGHVRNRNTAQGYADSSAWARGQAWGLYGFTVCYRYTKDTTFLNQAKKIAYYLFTHKNMPKDLVPYWDFDAPNIPNEPRDVSAAAVIASALYELDQYIPHKGYSDTANKIVKALSDTAYFAPLGTNSNFLLKHSVGSIPHGSEIDAPLVYADYYYLEALYRKLKYNK